jgi:hypothetical protein
MSAVMSDWITHHRITVQEYYRMAEAGILAEDARVELIEGVDLQGQQIRFFRSPGPVQYADVTTTTTPGFVSPIALPDVKIDLTGILEK